MNTDTGLTVKRNHLKPLSNHDLLLILKHMSLTLTEYAKEQYDYFYVKQINVKQTVIKEQGPV